MARCFAAMAVALVCACGPSIIVDAGDSTGAVGTTDGAMADDATGRPVATSESPQTSTSPPMTSGTSGGCDVETCPPCELGCVAEIVCDDAPFCDCHCGFEDDGSPEESSGSSTGGAPDCDVGELDCACHDDGTCSRGLACDRKTQTCVPSCEPGTEGCSCLPDGECNPGFACDPQQGICYLDLCPVGTEGCDCTPAGACDPIPEGLMCRDGICVDTDP